MGSLLVLSCATWVLLLLNPSLMYAHQTQVGNLTIHHQVDLAPEFPSLLTQSLALTQQSELYQPDRFIDVCLNDGSAYPRLLGEWRGGVAYSFLNKVVVNHCELDVEQRVAFWQWEVNNYELRKWDLTELLAHELTHAYQAGKETRHALKYPTWKVEGYAEYIAPKESNPISPPFFRSYSKRKIDLSRASPG